MCVEVDLDWSRQSFRTQVFAPVHNWDLNSSNQVLISTGAWKRKPSRQSGPRRQKRGVLPRGLDFPANFGSMVGCGESAMMCPPVQHVSTWPPEIVAWSTHFCETLTCIHMQTTNQDVYITPAHFLDLSLSLSLFSHPSTHRWVHITYTYAHVIIHMKIKISTWTVNSAPCVF